jgi:CRISPR-associated endonuclease/helicase Cas3
MSASKSVSDTTFREFFKQATDNWPYPYQERLAEKEIQSLLIGIPTGCGKTAAVVLAWLWHRSVDPENTPRRLVYCLPMRVLVEQTKKAVDLWLQNLKLEASVHVPVLVGGEARGEWDLYPEREAILIGTQDMLLSRALNRGYSMSRYRWPMHFGLLNNDCLWVMDEVQLMGQGVATARQLEAFRRSETEIAGPKGFGSFFHSPSVTWYMSATTSEDVLNTREWRSHQHPSGFAFSLTSREKAESSSLIGERQFALKRLKLKPDWHFSPGTQLSERASTILNHHYEMLAALGKDHEHIPRRTVVICNTVDRSVALYRALLKDLGDTELPEIDLVLLHSRFRPPDRKNQIRKLELEHVRKYVKGQIVVATQVIEAGVDLSCGILCTEIAPLASLVQRFGRLNRAGEFGASGNAKAGWTPVAVVVGLDMSVTDGKSKEAREKAEKEVARLHLPYNKSVCDEAWQALSGLDEDASPAALQNIDNAIAASVEPCSYSLHRHELLDFFDTDSNLSLGYTDVSPFVRGLDNDTDVYVLWRKWEGDPNDYFKGGVQDDELCAVPISQLIGREHGFAKWKEGWLWLGRESGWISARSQGISPGATLLLPADVGGYISHLGWTGMETDVPESYYHPSEQPDDEDMLSYLNHGWQSIPVHTNEVRISLSEILQSLSRDALLDASRPACFEAVNWHDIGKNHEAWRAAAMRALQEAGLSSSPNHLPLAKFSLSDSPKLRDNRDNRLTGADLRRQVYRLKRSFRPAIAHEVASALALRHWHIQAHGNSRSSGNKEAYVRELLAEYLVMSHHGRVRKVLRDEIPRNAPKSAKDADTVRGVQEGDVIPAVAIDGQAIAGQALSVDCRKMGRDADGHESYTRGVLRLLEHYGPFRLAYFEAVFRAADWRASKNLVRSAQEHNCVIHGKGKP